MPPPSDFYEAIVERSTIDDFRELIAQGHDINEPGCSHCTQTVFGNEARLTPLYYAVCWYHIIPTMTDILLELGADPSVRSYFQDGVWKTPIRNAVSHGRECVDLLIKHGADISAVDGEGNTVLHEAVRNTTGGWVDMLLELGIDTTVQNRDGKTALHCSRCPNDVNLRIIQAGTRDTLDLQDNRGETVLHYVTRNTPSDHWTVFGNFLLTAGASVFLRNANNETALDIAQTQYPALAFTIAAETEDRRNRAMAIGLGSWEGEKCPGEGPCCGSFRMI